MELGWLQAAVASYGYPALLVGTFLEGETCFILGGVAAGQGLLNPWLVGLTALAGGFLGDQVFFLLGRWRGAQVLGGWRKLARQAVLARRLVRRHAVLLMRCSRFLYGLRMVIPLACGTAGIHPLKFALLNFTSALLWAAAFGGLGYWLGGWMIGRLETMKDLQFLILLLLAVLGAGLLAGRLVRRRLAGLEAKADPPIAS